MPKLKQQGIVHIGLILILLAGLITGVYLVQHPQIFKPKAAGGKVWLIDESDNNLPQKVGGVYEVPSQQIRIYINQPTVWSPPGSSSRPQSRLPNLVTAAYAQTSQCNGTVYSCSDIKCDDGSTAPGTGCYETGGDLNNRYRTECLRNCPASSTTGGTGSSGTTTNTGTTADVSTPTITGASWDEKGDLLKITGSNFGNSGSVYYSRGGSEQIPSQSVNSWSASLVKIGAEIPLGATKSIENMISGGNYLKVCRADGKCSSFWSPIPDRLSQFRVDIPTAPNAAPQGQGAPAAPTQPEVTEATQEIRISSVIDYVKKDGVCEGNEDPAKHCMSLTQDNPDSRYTFAALLTKGYVSWWLANTTEDQNVYVGFISNKGQNFFQSIRVRIVRPQPTVSPGLRVSPSPAASPSPVPAAAKEDCSRIGICVNGGGYNQGQLLCSGTDESKKYSCPPEFPTCLTGTKCQAPCPETTGACVNEERKTITNVTFAGTDESEKYFCSNPAYPTCLTGATPSRPAPSPQPSPSPAKPSCRQSDGTCVDETFRTNDRQICTRGSSQSRDYDCPASHPICIFNADCREVPAPGGPGQPAASPISVKNNTDRQITVNKVEIIWPRFDLIPGLFPNSQSISGAFTLNPKSSRSFEIPAGVCSADDEKTKTEKEVKVTYPTEELSFDLTPTTTTAKGKYQCGGSGLVNIP